MLTAEQAMALIAIAKFERMTPSDRAEFEGVSEDALVAEHEGWTILIDEGMATFVPAYAGEDWLTFKLYQPSADELAG